MNYGFGKTFSLDSKFHALNGHVAFYEVTTNVDIVAAEPVDPKNLTDEEVLAHKCAQANYLRLVECLRGAQPVIVKAEEKKLVFVLEQAKTFGDNKIEQVSAHNFVEGKEGEEALVIKAKMAGIKGFEVKTGEIVDSEDDLVDDVEVKDAF